jgi:hypothetical protein
VETVCPVIFLTFKVVLVQVYVVNVIVDTLK